jgi:hypothetical protein
VLMVVSSVFNLLTEYPTVLNSLLRVEILGHF